ncbi:MAG: nitrous oxide-stimulated promoter family protein [Deltaproteobacteria bacterium]|nr:nitrous oxide-stimulated promoter family protein [Deltaproteobacteria bacterium]
MKNTNNLKQQIPPRLYREIKTIGAMVTIYCKDKHRGCWQPGCRICDECQAIINYATHRTLKCPLKKDKPACRYCTIHCYEENYRRRVREIMSYAGPRMLWRHPLLALLHLWDEHRSRKNTPKKINKLLT